VNRADADLALDGDVTAALLDDPVHGGEAETRSLVGFLRREERLEDLRKRHLVDSLARVVHG